MGHSSRLPRLHTFVVTNDFPPRIGGINYYVDQLFRRFPSGTVTVFSSTFGDPRPFDAAYPQEVIRLPTGMMLPTPGVRRELHALLSARRPDVVLFGATWPLAHMGPAIRRKLGIPFGGFTHGLEFTGALVPGMLRHIGRDASLLTAVSDWARRKLEPAFGWRDRMALLPSGIDVDHFHPGVSDAEVRSRHGLGAHPVVCCVSRLVARKGQDVLIRALPRIRVAVPGAKLLIVGSGPYEATLRRFAGQVGVSDDVIFAGAVSYGDLPAYFRAGHVFAMPCRSRLFGLDVEALGAVFLQAAAVGRPVVAGHSGGAPETVIAGETGVVVDPGSPAAVADAIAPLLADHSTAAGMGRAGAAWVHREWTWEAMTGRLEGLLAAIGAGQTGARSEAGRTGARPRASSRAE
jgi:phosphatidyl-myo-inositol dimannoside synthase